MDIFNPKSDAALYAAACHSYMTPNEPFRHAGLPPMTPDQRDFFLNDSIARFITGSADAPSGARIGAFTSVSQRRIGAFTTSDGVAQPDRMTYRVFADQKYSDEYWRAAFSPVQVADGERTWEILNVANPVTWAKIGEGGQVRAQRIEATKGDYDLADYGTELGFTYVMMKGRQLYRFIAALNLARDSYLATISEAHYSVIQTASVTGTGSQIGYEGINTDPVLDRDINTINAGLSKIASDLKDVVQGILMARYLLYVPEALEERAIMAIRARNEDIVAGRQRAGSGSAATVPVKRTLAIAPTLTNVAVANRGWLVFPGRKLQAANDGTMLDVYSDQGSQDAEQLHDVLVDLGHCLCRQPAGG